MKPRQQYQVKLLNIAKVLLLVLTFGFVFYKLVYAYHIESLINSFHCDTSVTGMIFLSLVLLLSVCNWMLEASKWRLLVNKTEDLSFADCCKAVLSGVALSLVTPNQIGDFAGRIIHLKKLDKIRGSLVTVIGHTAQVIMTAAFGLYAFIWFLHDQGHMTDGVNVLLNVLLFLFIILILIAYLNIHWISRITRWKKITPYLEVFSHYKRGELVQVLMIAFLRYFVFISQYVLLLNFYMVSTTLHQDIACVISTLFAQSFVPSFLLLDLGMRGASALWFFGFYTSEATAVLLSAYSLWVINLLLPGLMGLFFILKWRLRKK